ncbi:MAG TPA: hypothetical protein ENH91_08220 [Leeuwenhoekiella sp.]|nr:hypothetical protein [Leeuwenhoekiella sp.]
MNKLNLKSGKLIAVVAYATIIGTIIAIFMNLERKNAFARFHIRQAFGIFILFYLFGILVSNFDSWFISMPFFLFFAVLWGFGLLNAIQGVAKPIPLVGEKFQEWFTFIK